MIRNWFRSKRQLIADLNRQRDMLADADEEVRFWANEMNIGWDRADKEIREAHRERDQARRAHDATRDQLAKARGELERLREEIAHMERGDRPTFGVARYHDRPLVWQTADAIDQETAAKRLADGLGDA